jgi:DNA replication protein DnaC
MNKTKECEIHGAYLKYKKSYTGGVIEQRVCPKCHEEKLEKKKKEDQAMEIAGKISRYYELSNLPKRFKGITMDGIDLRDPEIKEAVGFLKKFLAKFPERLEQGSSGFFCGDCGTGKTMLACIMVEDVIKQGYPAHYTTTWQMIQRIRQGYKTGETNYYIKDYISKALLVIDEIGVQHGTNDERVLLYQVIDGRYNEVKPTVLISNSKNPVEDGFLDLRTIDRLKDGNGFSITFNGDSFRK